MTYVARRGETSEPGAVQRYLSIGRIKKLTEYAIRGGDYPNSIVINWVDTEHPVVLNASGTIATVPIYPNAAQILDGQHRVAGLRNAIASDSTVGHIEIPVAIYENLDTQAAADIFVSINTEQKPAPKSLVFDLYQVASTYLVDSAAVRAADIAAHLNETESSPYFGMIKFPQTNVRGGIALSTAVNGIRPLVEPKGILEIVNVKELHQQEQAITNFFEALRQLYGPKWASKDNVFLSALGFQGAIEFFRTRLIDYC